VINWSETVSARIPEGIKSVVWEPDSIRLATVGSEPTTITIWNSDTLEIETRLQGHRGTISDLAWGTAGLASVSNDRTIRIWDVTTGATRQIIPTIDQPLSLDWSPDGNQLAYVDNGNLVINSISSR
jgi:WD40 repeat protein